MSAPASSGRRGEIMAKRLTVSEKYSQLKAQTEAAGMKVREVAGKIVVERKRKPAALKTSSKRISWKKGKK
jgi:hypothetical protein